MSTSRAETPTTEYPRVVLVDAQDLEIGTTDKLAAHRTGSLHRAFSIFVFDSADRLLLQRRARGKYHSGGLWSNTCCSHPGPGETPLAAGHRRLREEMGFDCDLAGGYSFVYRAELDRGLVEHELDHVLIGRFDGRPDPDPHEVEAWSWAHVADIRQAMSQRPDDYTVWFKLAMEKLHKTAPTAFPEATRDLFLLLT
jgi:isopentenyl-diphosphate delta-isomerase